MSLIFPSELFTSLTSGSTATISRASKPANTICAGPISGTGNKYSFRTSVPADLATGSSPGSLLTVSGTNNAWVPTTTVLSNASIGAFLSTVIASGSAVSLSTTTPTNIGSLTLTPGDWDITGVVDYVTTGASTLDFKSGVSAASSAFGPQDSFVNMPLITTLLSDTFGHVLPTWRLDNRTSTGTTIFLVGQANFSVGAAAAYGTIRARKCAG